MGPLIPLFWTSWGCLPWISKQSGYPCIACFPTCMQQNPQIHLCCYTCWSFCSQNSAWAIPIMYLWISIGRTQVWDLLCCCLTVWDRTDTLPTGAMLAWHKFLYFKWPHISPTDVSRFLIIVCGIHFQIQIQDLPRRVPDLETKSC